MRDVRIRGGVRLPRIVDLHVAFIKWRQFPSGIPITTPRDVGAPEFGCHRFVRIRSIAGTRIANNVPLFGVEIEERTNEISSKSLSG
jgi:hypothetical protein